MGFAFWTRYCLNTFLQHLLSSDLIQNEMHILTDISFCLNLFFLMLLQYCFTNTVIPILWPQRRGDDVSSRSVRMESERCKYVWDASVLSARHWDLRAIHLLQQLRFAYVSSWQRNRLLELVRTLLLRLQYDLRERQQFHCAGLSCSRAREIGHDTWSDVGGNETVDGGAKGRLNGWDIRMSVLYTNMYYP